MDHSDLERALVAARLRPGERFELAVRTGEGALLARPFADPARAVAWLATAAAGDVYLGLNPLREGAVFPPGRARDADVALVRMLLLDCDPDGDDHLAAAELAETIAARLWTSLRVRPARIHTGRGRQLWLEHEPLAHEALALRARFLRVLGARFDLPGRAHVDQVVHNAARLARLPGTVNSRTGVVATIESQGAGAPVVLADLERFVSVLESEAGSPDRDESPPVRASRHERERPVPGGRGTWPRRYVTAAVERVLAAMTSAAEGSRNDTLNRCAFSLGQLEAGGAGVDGALDELREAACAAGLDEREVERTIRSGFAAGLQEPQQPPLPRPGRPPRTTKSGRGREHAGDAPRRERVGLTDLGNARRLVRRHGADLRYCDAAGGWFFWDGARWQRDDTGEAERQARKVPRAILLRASHVLTRAACAPHKEARERLVKRAEALRRHGVKSESERALRALLSLARTEPGVPVRADEFDTDPWLLNVRNGTLDLRTGTFRPHAREDLITKLVPVRYDAHATCPTWTAFLERVLAGSPELVAFVQRVLGYALTGHVSEQVLFFLYGTGANGKSTFIETVRALMGDFAVQASFEMFLTTNSSSRDNAVARLRGARFVSAVEAEVGARFNETLVKVLTGGDSVTARFLYREFFEYDPAFKLFFAANHKPTIRGTDRAIWRRIRLVPFTVTIPDEEKDPALKEKLLAELPGILRWAVEGCLAWRRDGGLGQPPEVMLATAEYRDDMDTLAGFLGERCVVAAGAHVAAAALYKTYVAWAEANGERATSQKAFSLRLTERGFVRRRSGANGSRVWHGIELATEQRERLSRSGGSTVSSGSSSYSSLPPSSFPEGREGSVRDGRELPEAPVLPSTSDPAVDASDRSAPSVAPERPRQRDFAPGWIEDPDAGEH